MATTIEAPEKLVGKSIRRREDPKLMTGSGNFLDDIRLPGLSYAAVLRSPVAHARIGGVDTNVATPRLLALGEVRQVGDPVAVVVAESVYQANDALEAIDVDFEELPAVVDSREAGKSGGTPPHDN